MANGVPTPPPRPGGPTGPGAPGGTMKKSTRNWLIIGGIGAAGLVIWYAVKSRSASSQQSTSATDLASQGIDPNTGIPYSQEYGGYGAMGVTPSLYGYVDPTTGAFISGAGAGSTVLQPSTNASWAQQVEAYLQTLGYDPTAVGAAIGKYLTGQALTSDQQGIVAAALGFFGQPPQGAPAPVNVPPTGQGGGGGGNGGASGWKGGFNVGQINMAGTLQQIAGRRHWDAAYLAAVEKLNHWTLQTRINRGQQFKYPNVRL